MGPREAVRRGVHYFASPLHGIGALCASGACFLLLLLLLKLSLPTVLVNLVYLGLVISGCAAVLCAYNLYWHFYEWAVRGRRNRQ